MSAGRRIDRFGIELEGGWDTCPPSEDLLRRDGSVSCDGSFYVGECTSEPFDDLSMGLHWVEANYPQHRSVTCGMHVHMSFSPQRQCVGWLADSESYWRILRSDLETWGKQRNVKRRDFWSRLKGNNSYARTERWDAERALKGYDVERYVAVNFHSLRKHGTVEIRVLPMFASVKLAVGAITTVLQSTDNFLSSCASNPGVNAPVEIADMFDVGEPDSVVLPRYDPFGA